VLTIIVINCAKILHLIYYNKTYIYNYNIIYKNLKKCKVPHNAKKQDFRNIHKYLNIPKKIRNKIKQIMIHYYLIHINNRIRK